LASQNDLIQKDSEDPVSYTSLLYKVRVQKDSLSVSRKFPPKRREIAYTEIASVKHERMVDYGTLTGLVISLVLLLAINFFEPVINLMSQLVLEAGHAMGYFTTTAIDASVRSTTADLLMIVSLLLFVAMFYYGAKFVLSFTEKLVIYRSGKKPLTFPLPLTGDALAVMAMISQNVKDASGLSKAEVEKIISEHLDGLLKQRMRMETELISGLKEQASLAKTDEQRAAVKAKLQESVEKLEEQDRMIDTELKKTGLSKEEIFRKYRIKPPKEEFLNAILKEGGIE
jgi:hypothetical protein